MSQDSGVVREMPLKGKRIRTRTKVILAATIPVYLAILGFCILGVNLRSNVQIFPNVSIDGVDVSWLTIEEAMQTLDVDAYDARVKGAAVTIAFPDDSEFTITGEAAGLGHNARLLIDEAFSRGRGLGFVADTIAFLQREYNQYFLGGAGEFFEVSYCLDTESLHASAGTFTENYNLALAASKPRILEDRVILVKGAGQVSADEAEVYILAFDGLFKSLAGGRPAAATYYLPEISANREELISIWDSVYATPLCALYDPETKEVSESAAGVSFDVFDTLALINAADSGKTVTFNLNYTQPEITRDYLEDLLFRDLIGECVTRIDGTANRLNNIVLASAEIDGVILEPGEEFSFNRTVGRRTYERGFRSAPAYSGGEIVYAIGGGICQVSSSIYSAIKDTEIKVTERYAHGRPVAYLPRGRDATVSWGTLDFKFVNNTEYPLRINAEVDERKLTVQVFGTLETQVLNSFE